MASSDRPAAERFRVCPECDFGAAPEQEFCPDCGVRLRPARRTLWQRLRGDQPPARTTDCLREQQRQIEAQIARIEAELARLAQRQEQVEARARAAVEAGRVARELTRAVEAMAAALRQRRRLLSNYRAELLQLELDRTENRLARIAAVELAGPVDQPIRCLSGHSDWVRSVSFSPDGRLLATGSDDRTARPWQVATGRELQRFDHHTGIVNSVGFSPDGRLIATGASDQTARLWEVETGGEVRCLSGHSGSVYTVSFSPDGRLLATGSDYRTAQLWEVETGREVRCLSGHSDWVRSVSFSADGRLLATGSRDGTARLWEVASGREVRCLRGHSNGVRWVSFSPDGRLLATGSDDRTARLWEVATGREVRCLRGHSGSVYTVSFSPDGRLLATGSGSATARLWEVATGREVRRLAGDWGGVLSVCFSPDGRLLATGSGYGTAWLWLTTCVAIRASTAGALAVRGTLPGDGVADGLVDPARRRCAALCTVALELASRATTQQLTRLLATAGGAAADRDGLWRNGRGMIDDLAALADELGQALPDEVSAVGAALLARLALQPTPAVLTALIAELERLGTGLATCSATECEQRLKSLGAVRGQAADAAKRFAALPAEAAALPEAAPLRDTIAALPAQLDELEDLITARLATADLAGVRPIADGAPLAALRRQREALAAAGSAADALLEAAAGDEVEALLAPAAGEPALGGRLHLAEREAALRAIEEEYQRLLGEEEALGEVDDMLLD